jgi:hypothetical protein
MSRQLADYVEARQDALVCVLEMLTAEYQLSDENSSVLDLANGEREIDAAAAKLSEATDALDTGRQPVGWDKPPEVTGSLMTARKRFVWAALRCLSSDYAPETADRDASAEHADEQLCLAARNLAADVAAGGERTP